MLAAVGLFDMIVCSVIPRFSWFINVKNVQAQVMRKDDESDDENEQGDEDSDGNDEEDDEFEIRV